MVKSDTLGRHTTLAALLAWHERHQGLTALPENLGDGALYFSNPVFRSIRDAAVQAGCRFTLEDAHGYFAWPLVSLPRVLETKIIPYRRTRAALANLENMRPGFFTTKHTEMVEHQVNAVLHEGAHCVADAKWQKAAPELARLSLDHRIVLRFSLSEAFANAAEIAAMAHAVSPEERWGLGFNSYWGNLPAVGTAWEKLTAGIGAKSAAHWLILCFLAANLGLDEEFSKMEKDFAALAGISAPAFGRTKKELRFFADEAMNLNPEFRQNTAQVFYASLGLKAGLEKLLSFNVIEALQGDRVTARVIAALAGILATTPP